MEMVIGLDFGSLSCRGILVEKTGKVLAESEYKYPHGAITDYITGSVLPNQWVLQDPSDFENGLYEVVTALVKQSRVDVSEIKGIGIDTTASTVIAVDSNMRPLCQNEEFLTHLHAWPKMWKHHAAQKEAEDINRVSKEMNLSVMENFGGSINSEFFIPKVLECYREDREVFDNADTFMEMGDWLTSLLTGKLVRGIPYLTCKAMCTQKPEYPSEEFFERVEPGFGPGFYGKFSFKDATLVYPGESAGTLEKSVAEKLGLPESTVVSGPQMDGYAGLPGSGVAESSRLMMVLGTSTGFMLLDEGEKPVKGMCASVKNSMEKGYLCHAAGQASTGDNLSWFINNIFPAKYEREAQKLGVSNYDYISILASKKKASESRLLALDWFNGNKSVLANTALSGAMVGLTLNTKPEDIFRSLVESSAFGAKVIIDRLKESGVKIDSIVASGGIANKNPFMVQLYSNVLNLSIDVCPETQAAAMGSAMYAASSCGLYGSVQDAVKGMRKQIVKTYIPNEDENKSYEELYKEYIKLHDYFGLGSNSVMQKLKER